jgi:hypothetical protein
MSVDLADIKMRDSRLREFAHAVGGATIHLRHPTRYDVERLAGLNRGDDIALMRALVCASVIGWDGVTVADAFPEAKNGADPLEFSADALAAVCDERTEWVRDLGMAVVNRIGARRERIEADRKNSSSGSAGSGPAERVDSSPGSGSEGS